MTAAALELAGVTKRFGRTEILGGVDLAIPVGERHALIGPNGAGKSTLFHLMSGRLPATSGRIRLLGRDITGLPPYRINRLGLARSFQITSVFPRLSVFDNIRCATLYRLGHRYSFLRRLARLDDATARAEAIVDQIGLAGRASTPAANLTYAEQRALEIGITVAGDAPVILLDEPTAGMSRAESIRAIALIRRMTEGRTLVMVEHDMSVVFELADRISVLVQGRILASGTPAQIRSDGAVRQAYLGQVAGQIRDQGPGQDREQGAEGRGP